ncbi:RnfABCDGE type electron transport complex subunit B [Neisseriaceae bacterium PsAf]|nr:RnfABCDGE type electron transport complex subunit B [Neisseriaceae bacterium PsAf]
MKAEKINQLLPQTQCQQCGYEGCLPYATALAKEEAEINLCLPGKNEVMFDLANLLDKPPIPVEPSINQTVYIDEMICIGCKACIRVCPVDAIVGTTKKMHTVINQECTGCKLCIPACPVDCIFPEPEDIDYLPKNPILSDSLDPRTKASQHAKIRFDHRNQRLQRLKEEKQTYLEQSKNKALKKRDNDTSNTSSLAIQSLLDKAKRNARNRKLNRVQIEDQEHSQQKILQEQKRAAYRKAQKDFRYGSEQEKAAALAFLRKWKEENKQDNGG